jgi:hypothetical protein
VASLVTDQARKRDRAIVSAEKIVQHFGLPSLIQSEYCSVRVQAAELSCAKEVSSRVRHQTPIGSRPVCARESMQDRVCAIAGDPEHGSVFMAATCRGYAIEFAGYSIEEEAGLRSCTIRPAMEGVQDSELSIRGESEHSAATGLWELWASLVSTGLGHAIQVAI